jgi:alcohol dehydrogenase class IV
MEARYQMSHGEPDGRVVLNNSGTSLVHAMAYTGGRRSTTPPMG